MVQPTPIQVANASWKAASFASFSAAWCFAVIFVPQNLLAFLWVELSLFMAFDADLLAAARAASWAAWSPCNVALSNASEQDLGEFTGHLFFWHTGTTKAT